MTCIAINGFGRIGRMVMRVAAKRELQVNIINDPSCKDPGLIAYLFKYDSTHGTFRGDVCYDDKHLIVNGKKTKLFKELNPKKVPWGKEGGLYVVESTGKFKTKKKAKPILDAGAKKVIVSAASNDAPMYVMGVNLEECYDPKAEVVSMASCATNCLAPMAKILHENFEIVEGLMTTVHAVTNSNAVLDVTGKRSKRMSRGCFQSMIPGTTGAAKATAIVLPELKGKITAMAIRCPLANVSLTDFTVRLKKATCYDEIKKKVKEASECKLKGILGYTEESVVSQDFLSCELSSVFDALAGIELNSKFYKFINWFDNEMGYSTRIVDLIQFMQKKDAKAEKDDKSESS